MAGLEARLYFSVGGRSPHDAAEGVRRFAIDLQAAWTGTPVQVSYVLKDYLNHVAQALAARHGRAWPATSPTTLSRRSGTAVQSILHSVKVAGTTWASLQGAIGGVDYLAVHEFGGTIKGRGKMLTIPLPAALNSDGTPIMRSARDWQDTFVATSKAGNLIIFQKRAGRIVPLYVLKDQVTIRPRLGMAKELETEVPYFLERAADLVAREMTQNIGA